MALAAARLGVALRRLSTLAPLGSGATVQLREDGLAALPKTLPIHQRDDAQLEPREGASLIEVVIDGNPVQIEAGSSILQVCATQ